MNGKPEDEPNMLEKATPGYVKNEIKAHKSRKRASPASRARKEARGCLAKIIRKAASISELLTEHDQRQNLRVIRDAKKATHRIWDGEQKKLIEVPDHKTRLAAVALDLAYREGRPRERSESLVLHADLDDFQAMIDLVKSSPGAMKSIPAELIETSEKAQDVATDKAKNSESESDSMARTTSSSQ
jgi:hypothetical protein